MSAAQITKEQIARRAYEIYLARGGQDGHDVEDWFAAKADLERHLASFDVVLVDPGTREIEVVRRLRELTGLGLREIRFMIDTRPRAIKQAVPRQEAEEVRTNLEKLGARVSIKSAS
jgi:ribosomal protein L7/L12